MAKRNETAGTILINLHLSVRQINVQFTKNTFLKEKNLDVSAMEVAVQNYRNSYKWIVLLGNRTEWYMMYGTKNFIKFYFMPLHTV